MATPRIELMGGGTGYVCSEGNSKLIHCLPLPLNGGRQDLHSVRLLSVPEELERVAVHIGRQRVLEWDCGGSTEGVNLLPLALCDAPYVLPLSLSSSMTAEVVLHYRSDFVTSNEEWSEVEEVTEHEEYSDSESEFFDGDQVSWGRRVHRSSVPTGRLVRKLTGGAPVRVPFVELALVESQLQTDPVMVAFWQKIVLKPGDRDYALRLARDYGFRDQGFPVPDASDWHEPRTFVVKNRIRFSYGIAGVTHVY